MVPRGAPPTVGLTAVTACEGRGRHPPAPAGPGCSSAGLWLGETAYGAPNLFVCIQAAAWRPALRRPRVRVLRASCARVVWAGSARAQAQNFGQRWAHPMSERQAPLSPLPHSRHAMPYVRHGPRPPRPWRATHRHARAGSGAARPPPRAGSRPPPRRAPPWQMFAPAGGGPRQFTPLDHNGGAAVALPHPRASNA